MIINLLAQVALQQTSGDFKYTHLQDGNFIVSSAGQRTNPSIVDYVVAVATGRKSVWVKGGGGGLEV